MAGDDAPIGGTERAPAASTNSFSFKLSTTPRTMRAVLIQPTKVKRVTMSRSVPGGPSTVLAQAWWLGNCSTISSVTRMGKARNKSVSRMSALSKRPPRKPANARNRGADHAGSEGDREPDEQRGPTTPEYAGEEIATDRVGAEVVLGGGSQQLHVGHPLVPHSLVGRVRSEKRSEDHRQGDQEQHDRGHHGGAMAEIATKRQLGG